MMRRIKFIVKIRIRFRVRISMSSGIRSRIRFGVRRGIKFISKSSRIETKEERFLFQEKDNLKKKRPID